MQRREQAAGSEARGRASSMAGDTQASQPTSQQFCWAKGGPGRRSPTLASSASLPGHQHTSSTVASCPPSLCTGCRRVPAAGAPPLPAARLPAWAARSHASTCGCGEGRGTGGVLVVGRDRGRAACWLGGGRRLGCRMERAREPSSKSASGRSLAQASGACPIRVCNKKDNHLARGGRARVQAAAVACGAAACGRRRFLPRSLR